MVQACCPPELVTQGAGIKIDHVGKGASPVNRKSPLRGVFCRMKMIFPFLLMHIIPDAFSRCYISL